MEAQYIAGAGNKLKSMGLGGSLLAFEIKGNKDLEPPDPVSNANHFGMCKGKWLASATCPD
ncbi:hypothetical protein MASR2M70_21880 [Bacillota bacterium]